MKAIILDMYGVILKQTGDDFFPYVKRAFPDLTPKEIYTPWFKADSGQTSSLAMWESYGFKGDIEKIKKEYLDTIEINDGFHDFASSVSQYYKMAIISNDSSRRSKYLREKFDINKYFQAISISGDLKIQKPDERVYQLTIKQLDCEPTDCLYVDDRERNLETAGKIGMDAVLFNSRNVQYDGKIVTDFIQLKNMLL